MEAILSSSSSSAFLLSSRNHQQRLSFFFISKPTTTNNSNNSIAAAAAALGKWKPPGRLLHLCTTSSTSPLTTAIIENTTNIDSSSSPDVLLLPKTDKSGRFCSPRAARELALVILYAACLDGSDPVRLFDKRLNARTESGYEFDKGYLLEYNHMSFGGPPVTTHTPEEADDISRLHQFQSHIEAEVLSAPPKLVYSKLILRFTRKLLAAVAENWDTNVLAIDKVAPQNWKNEPAGRILEFSVLHLAMSEIAVLGTRHQIVINEAVDLAKRFCDGAAPRIINGCLRTFLTELNRNEPDNVRIRLPV